MTDTMQRRAFLKGVPSSVMAASVVSCSAASGTTAQKSRPSRRSDLERGGVTVLPPPPTNAAVITVGSNQYTYDPTGGNTNGQTVATLDSYTDPSARFVMTNVLVTRADYPVRVYFRSVPGWSCAIFEYGDIANQTNTNLAAYTATVGGQVFNLIGHWKWARWRWQSGPWPFPMASIDSLVAAKLLPKYDPALAMNPTIWPDVVYQPMLVAPMTRDMGTQGARADIGVINDWAATYICAPTAQRLTNTLNIGEICGSWPIMYRASATGPVVDQTQSHSTIVQAVVYSQGNFIFTGPPGTVIPITNQQAGLRTVTANGAFWCYGNMVIPAGGTLVYPGRTAGPNNNLPSGPATLVPAIPGVSVSYDLSSWVLGTGLGPSADHWPMMSFVPWLLTGDPYFLENLQSEAMWVWGTPNVSLGYPTGWGQTRTMAWCLRNFAMACAATPSGTLPSWLLSKATLENTLTLNLPAYRTLIASTDPIHSAFHTFNGSIGSQGNDGPYLAKTVYTAWQEDYVCSALALCVLYGYSDWLPILQWSAYNLINRSTPGGSWDPRLIDTYHTSFRASTSSPPYADWPTARDANLPLLAGWLKVGDPSQIDAWGGVGSVDYIGGLMAALGLYWQATGTAQAATNAAYVHTSGVKMNYEKCFAHS